MQKKLEHGETKVRILNSNFDRLKQIITGKMDAIEEMKTKLEEMKENIENNAEVMKQAEAARESQTWNIPQQVLHQAPRVASRDRNDVSSLEASYIPSGRYHV